MNKRKSAMLPSEASMPTDGAYPGERMLMRLWHEDRDRFEVLDDAERARELCRMAQAGDRAARDELVTGNLRLVEMIAARFTFSGVPLTDLIQEGCLGLMRAVESYDGRASTKFSTYSVWWIFQAVQRCALHRDMPIHIPENVLEEIRAARREARPIAPKWADRARDAMAIWSLDSLDDLVELTDGNNGADFPTRGGLVPHPGPGVEEQAVEKADADTLLRVVRSVLLPREYLVLCMRFGLGDFHEHTLDEAGRKLQITRERVRQIEARGLTKLRSPRILRRLGGVTGLTALMRSAA